MYIVVEEAVYRHRIWRAHTYHSAVELAKDVASTEDSHHRYVVYSGDDTEKRLAYVQNESILRWRDTDLDYDQFKALPNSDKYKQIVVEFEND